MKKEAKLSVEKRRGKRNNLPRWLYSLFGNGRKWWLQNARVEFFENIGTCQHFCMFGLNYPSEMIIGVFQNSSGNYDCNVHSYLLTSSMSIDSDSLPRDIDSMDAFKEELDGWILGSTTRYAMVAWEATIWEDL